MQTTFKYHKQSFPVPAEEAGIELERIRLENGGTIQPQTVVDESRPTDAVLHPAFEWDDQAAAEEWRKNQARVLIRSVRVVKTRDDGEEKVHRAYVNLLASESDPQGYHSLVEVVSDADKRAQLVETAWRELSVWKARFKELMDASVDPDLVMVAEVISKKEIESAA